MLMLLSRNKRLRQIAGLLETGNFLFLRLLLKNRAAAAVYPGEIYRTYMAHAREGQWSCRSIFEILPSTQRVRAQIEHIPSRVIATPLEQLACLALLTKASEPEAVFEIGTFRGRTALNFALNAPAEARIYTLDLPPDDRESARTRTNSSDANIITESQTGCEYRGSDVEHKITQLYGDSSSFDFSPYFGKMDLVYVDGAHHYDAVKRDSENAIRMVRDGGYVLWDEFCNYGDYNDVTRAVMDTVPKGEVVQVANTQLALYRKGGPSRPS
jgi:predicted O-methyltransferase YrrM